MNNSNAFLPARLAEAKQYLETIINGLYVDDQIAWSDIASVLRLVAHEADRRAAAVEACVNEG